MRRRLRPGATWVALAACLWAAAGAPASAEPVPGGVVTSVAYQFAPGGQHLPTGSVLLLEGTELWFANADVLDHTVTAVRRGDDPPAFDSGVAGPGDVLAVTGTAALAPGDYDFVCTLHPFLMTGRLSVLDVPA